VRKRKKRKYICSGEYDSPWLENTVPGNKLPQRKKEQIRNIKRWFSHVCGHKGKEMGKKERNSVLDKKRY